MKILVIGGVTVADSAAEYQPQRKIVDRTMREFGERVASAGHELVACSPFIGSADRGAILGAAAAGGKSCAFELHFPDVLDVRMAVTELTTNLPSDRYRIFAHPPNIDDLGNPEWTYSWLYAQLAAMDRAHAVVALGGRLGGAAGLLLTLAESRRKHVLPFAFLGGAAAQSFQRKRYALEDRFSDRIAVLQTSERLSEALPMLQDLTLETSASAATGVPLRFFISYARLRPEEADFVEMTLRRRNHEVFRDERDFGAGRSIPDEIEANLYRANVFIAIWCKEYACSPWCFDELDLALRRSVPGGLAIWILCVDDTRVVPPTARGLVNYPCRSRDELEGHLLKLLERTK